MGTRRTVEVVTRDAGRELDQDTVGRHALALPDLPHEVEQFAVQRIRTGASKGVRAAQAPRLQTLHCCEERVAGPRSRPRSAETSYMYSCQSCRPTKYEAWQSWAQELYCALVVERRAGSAACGTIERSFHRHELAIKRSWMHLACNVCSAICQSRSSIHWKDRRHAMCIEFNWHFNLLTLQTCFTKAQRPC